MDTMSNEIVRPVVTEKDLNRPSENNSTKYKIYEKYLGDPLDFDLKEDEFDSDLPRICHSKKEVEENIENIKNYHNSRKFEGWRKKVIVIVEEKSHTKVKRSIVDKITLEPVFSEPTDQDHLDYEKAQEIDLKELFPDPQFETKAISHKHDIKELEDLKEATIVDVGFHPDQKEGGLTFDYEKNGIKKRLVLGFNELGMWTAFCGKI